MLDRIIAQFKRTSEELSGYLYRRTHSLTTTPGLCCINIEKNALHVVYGGKDKKDPFKISLCESRFFEQEDGWQADLNNFVEVNQLKGTSCSWILSQDQYTLLNMDALPVSAAEFQNAIRWKVRDLLPFPVEQAVIDHCPVPHKKSIEQKTGMMVVAARQDYLRAVSKEITKTGLELTTIDIAELALRNIANLYGEGEKSTALVYFQEKHCQYIIVRSGILYFSRRIDLDLDNLFKDFNSQNKAARLDKIALEIQRSLDYYKSQWHQALPAHLLWISIKPFPSEAMDYLQQLITIPVIVLDLNQKLNPLKPINTEDQAYCLLALGGFLRKESQEYATTD